MHRRAEKPAAAHRGRRAVSEADEAVAPAASRTHADWPFPFASPGRPAKQSRRLARRTDSLWPYREPDVAPLPARGVISPLALDAFKAVVAGWCDDVGIISIDDPAIAHEAEEVRYVYPHARSLVCLVGRENKAAMQSRYLPSANHELYGCEERVFAMGRATLEYIQSLGGEGLTTTVGWPQEVSRRWADKIWPLSHKLVAQAAGLGVIGTSRNFLHRRFGAYCLLDTVLTNLEFERYDAPVPWNPCMECNLCVASCPTEAIGADGDFDFFACYNHTYRDSIPGFLDLVRDLAESKPTRFARRWTDVEIAALWQSLAFRVEYRCFNCVSTCPAEIERPFHDDKEVRRRYIDETLKPLTSARVFEEQQFVIDTPGARRKYGIPAGHWRTQADPHVPASRSVRLVSLGRIRTQDVDAMMRNMPQYFRSREARGLAFTTQFDLTGPGGGRWVMEIADRRCRIERGSIDHADLIVRAPAQVYLGIHQGTHNPVLEIVRGRLKLGGRRRLFLAFRRVFPAHTEPGILARLASHTWMSVVRLARGVEHNGGTHDRG